MEAERYNLVLGHIDTVRAAGGGATRGIDYNITLAPAGVGGPGSPLLNALTTNTNPTDTDSHRPDGAELHFAAAAIAVRAFDGLSICGGAKRSALRSAVDR